MRLFYLLLFLILMLFSRHVIAQGDAAGDFAPLYHKELVRGKLNAYNWKADGITGADSVEGNAHKGFNLPFS
jgi:hypothetical protein